MDEKRLQEQVTRAVEKRCAHLKPDPYLAQKVLRAAERKETVPVKHKMSFGLILAIVLMLLSVTAVAAALLSGMELIEQAAVPMAQGNDGDVRPVNEFSNEELHALISAAAENGIILDDSTSTMIALRNGEGYYEEEAIMDICREVFGGLYYEWTAEQRHWYEEIMIAIGFSEENYCDIPGPDDLPSEEVRALARQTVREKYGADVPIDDPDRYRCQEWFYGPDNDTEPTAFWTFDFLPKDLEGAAYSITIDSQGQWIEHASFPQDWSAYTESELDRGIDTTYGYRTMDQVSWTPEAWVTFGQMLPQAERSDRWSVEYEAYLASTYLLPEAADIPVEKAKEIALTDAAPKDYASVCAVLLSKGEQRIWKVSFRIVEDVVMRETVVYEIDSRTGEILYKAKQPIGTAEWSAWVLQETYESTAASDDRITLEEAILLAQDAFRKELGDDTIPYTDENYYTIDARYLEGAKQGRYWLIFETKTMEYGRASADVMDDGTVEINYVGASGVNGDNLHGRFEDVYGSCNSWDQSIWVQFDQEMEKYEPTTFEGKLFKQTDYPDASTVKLTLDDALDVVYQDCGGDHICAMLIDAEPNPVWKVRSDPMPYTYLYEIDAMTGEIMDKEIYVIQMKTFDHIMKLYTLRRDFMPAHMAEHGLERVAMELCVKANMEDFYAYSADSLMSGAYRVETDGMTVSFTAYDPTCNSYIVTVAEDAMSAEIEVIAPLKDEVEPLTDEEKAALYAQYGGQFEPLTEYPWYHDEADADSHVVKGAMSLEEAESHAFGLLLDAVGKDAVDAFGDIAVGYACWSNDDDNESITWRFYFVSPDDPAQGWKVTFGLEDGVPEDWADVKSVSDESNG